MSTQSTKQLRWIGIWILLCFALVLSACSPAISPAASRVDPTQEPDRPTATPTPAENPADLHIAYTNDAFGFSLRYPTGYELQQIFDQTYTITALQAPQGTPDKRGLVRLEVERNLDQDAGWYADQMVQDASLVNLPLYYSTRVIDGQQAFIFDRVSGQDLSRQVFVVYQGYLYHLTFVPDDPQMGEAYRQMETLYTAVMNSLRFLPERRAVPAVLSVSNMIYQIERASESRSQDDLARLLGDEFLVGYGMPTSPESVTFERYGSSEAVQWILDKSLSPSPDLTLERQVGGVVGDPFPYFPFFPDEVVTPVLAKGWGPQGADEAMLIIGHRKDGSLYWQAVFVAQ